MVLAMGPSRVFLAAGPIRGKRSPPRFVTTRARSRRRGSQAQHARATGTMNETAGEGSLASGYVQRAFVGRREKQKRALPELIVTRRLRSTSCTSSQSHNG